MGLFIRENIQFITIILLWVAAAFFLGTISGLFVILTMLLFLRSGMTDNAFLSFVVLLVISDSLFPEMSFAKSFKNVAVVLLAVYSIIGVKREEVKVRFFMYFMPFFVLAAIGILYSPVVITSVQKLLSYIFLAILVPFFITINYNRFGEEFFKKFVFVLFFICVVGYSFNFINPEVSISHGGRFRGIFGNPNGQGIFLIVFTLFFTLIRNKFSSLFSRREVIIIYATILFLIIVTGSRTALLSFLLFFMFSYLFKRSSVAGFIVFGIVILLTEYIISNFVNIIMSLGLENEFRLETLTEGSGRLIAWDFAWQDIQKSLMIGRGFGYDEYLMRSNAETLMKMGHEGGVHNTYLIVWLNSGLIGFLCFLGAFITIFIKASFKNHLSFPIMITVFFSIMFEPWLASSLNPYTIILFSTLVSFFILDGTKYQKVKTDSIEIDQ